MEPQTVDSLVISFKADVAAVLRAELTPKIEAELRQEFVADALRADLRPQIEAELRKELAPLIKAELNRKFILDACQLYSPVLEDRKGTTQAMIDLMEAEAVYNREIAEHYRQLTAYCRANPSKAYDMILRERFSKTLSGLVKRKMGGLAEIPMSPIQVSDEYTITKKLKK